MTVFEKLTKDAHTLADELDDICGCDCSTCPAFHHCAKYNCSTELECNEIIEDWLNTNSDEAEAEFGLNDRLTDRMEVDLDIFNKWRTL